MGQPLATTRRFYSADHVALRKLGNVSKKRVVGLRQIDGFCIGELPCNSGGPISLNQIAIGIVKCTASDTP